MLYHLHNKIDLLLASPVWSTSLDRRVLGKGSEIALLANIELPTITGTTDVSGSDRQQPGQWQDRASYTGHLAYSLEGLIRWSTADTFYPLEIQRIYSSDMTQLSATYQPLHVYLFRLGCHVGRSQESVVGRCATKVNPLVDERL